MSTSAELTSRILRTTLGRTRIGEPLADVLDAFCAGIEHNDLPLERQAFLVYAERVFMDMLPRIIDKSLTAAQLEVLPRAEVQAAAIELLRDVLRRVPALGLDAEDADEFTGVVAEHLGASINALPVSPVNDFDRGPEWARPIAARLGLDAFLLYVTHDANVEGVRQWFDAPRAPLGNA